MRYIQELNGSSSVRSIIFCAHVLFPYSLLYCAAPSGEEGHTHRPKARIIIAFAGTASSKRKTLHRSRVKKDSLYDTHTLFGGDGDTYRPILQNIAKVLVCARLDGRWPAIRHFGGSASKISIGRFGQIHGSLRGLIHGDFGRPRQRRQALGCLLVP